MRLLIPHLVVPDWMVLHQERLAHNLYCLTQGKYRGVTYRGDIVAWNESFGNAGMANPLRRVVAVRLDGTWFHDLEEAVKYMAMKNVWGFPGNTSSRALQAKEYIISLKSVEVL